MRRTPLAPTTARAVLSLVACVFSTLSCAGAAAQSGPLTPSTKVYPSPQPAQPAEPATARAQPKPAEPARASLPSGSKWRGTDGGPEFSARVIKTEQEWTSLWRRLGQPAPKPLGTDMAVVVEIGERMTAGYRPEVIAASERNGHLIVEYTEGAPGSDAIVAQVLTRPWAAALIPRVDLPAEFRRVTP